MPKNNGKQIGRYPDKIRKEAAVQYAIKGNMSQVARDMNINVNTLKSWSTTDLWVSTIADVHQSKASEHRAMYSAIVDKAQQQTLAKIGDATASQSALIACQATDKVRLLDNMPTSISGRTDSLESLKDQFRKLSSTHTIVPNAKIIDNTNDSEDESH